MIYKNSFIIIIYKMNNNKKNSCEEILINIQRTLHECCDNKKEFMLRKTINLNNCDNIKNWSEDVSYNVGLTLDVRRPIILGKYIIEYNVKNRILTIT